MIRRSKSTVNVLKIACHQSNSGSLQLLGASHLRERVGLLPVAQSTKNSSTSVDRSLSLDYLKIPVTIAQQSHDKKRPRQQTRKFPGKVIPEKMTLNRFTGIISR